MRSSKFDNAWVCMLFCNKRFSVIFFVALCSLLGFHLNNISPDANAYDLEFKNVAVTNLNVGSVQTIFNTNDNSSATLLVIYASWCKHCVKNFPLIINIVNKYPELNPVFISLDENQKALENFLSRTKKISFPPYRAPPSDTDVMFELLSEIKKRNCNFGGGIPYMAVLNKNGFMETEGRNIRSIELCIKKLVSNNGVL